MSDLPRVVRRRSGRMSLIRRMVGFEGGGGRQSTVVFTAQEWEAVTNAVFEERGLITVEQSRRERGPIYEEVERAQNTIASLERELTYASGQDDDDEVADPPPLAAHGTEWAS
jgi:hypothetical protein